MLIDIIIPAYNPGSNLLDALKSCKSQSYKDYTVTVVDDNSTENVKEIVDKFPGFNYIRNDKNLGPGAARNVGIRNTSGELISMLDADDIMHPEKLRLAFEAFSKNNVGMVCGNYRILVNRSRIRPPFYRFPIKVDHSTLMRQNYVASGSVTMKRSVIEDVGYFNEEYWIAEDYDLWLRISEKYPIKYLHEVQYYYCIEPGGDSLTQRKDIQAKHLSNLASIKRASAERVNARKKIQS